MILGKKVRRNVVGLWDPFLSGCARRLHKPVRVIRSSSDASPLLQDNLTSAARTALLLLPERFDAAEFYTTIAGLSYTGEAMRR